jgi:hypothetical protein
MVCSSVQHGKRDLATEQHSQHQHSRRQLLQLIGLGAAGLAAAALPVPAAKAAATTAISSSKALEEYMKLEDDNKLRDQRSLDNIRYAALAYCAIVHLHRRSSARYLADANTLVLSLH